jgi:hypothetical protein
MRTFGTGTLVFAVVCALAGPGRPQDSDDARALIDRAIKAHGGADKLAKHKAETWKAKGTMYAGDMKAP